MVQNKGWRWFNFAVFIFPALLLYGIFFIYPFVKGIGISFSNWDGLSQKAPITMEKSAFESQILAKLSKQADKDFLLSVYTLKDGENYSNSGLQGFTRFRVESLMKKAGWVNPNNRFVGLKNYKDIFGGKLAYNFYPRFYNKAFYNETSELPGTFPKADYERFFLSRLTPEERSLAESFYALEEREVEGRKRQLWVLSKERTRSQYEDVIWDLPEVYDADPLAIEGVLSAIRDAGLAEDPATLDKAMETYFGLDKPFSEGSRQAALSAANSLYEMGAFRSMMAEKFYQRRFDMGVVGFTIFFTVMSVILGNLLAFLLALALDTGIRTKNVLRSVFFLPNVLSMIVVALIWSIIFSYVLPSLTGVKAWMSDLDKAPWLIVMAAVWRDAGYFMVIYLAGLQNIPTEILEAAKIDGASGFSRLKNIILPMLMPAFTICFFLSTANALKTFDLIYALSKASSKALGTANLVMDIFDEAYQRKNWGLAAAKAVVLFGAIFAVTGIQIRLMSRKEVEL